MPKRLQSKFDIDTRLGMSNQLGEVRARQIIQKIRSLTNDVMSLSESTPNFLIERLKTLPVAF